MGQVKKVNKVRTYDCIYCKRGFTKAQALGGHMNLHGKTRAKAKTVASHDHYPPPPSHKAKKNDSDYNSMAYKYFTNSTPSSSDNCVGPRPAVNLIQLPTRGLSFSLHNYPVSYAHENLSSRIGPVIMVGGDDQERNEVVDVELRLGLKP